jgi:type II secretory pathway pseudopilin PulG
MKILKNKSGLILAEALLAIAMLAIGSLVVASIIQSALTTTALSKNYLIAQNLATEAMEAVKSVRDTNWLLQADAPECWLELVPDSDGVCGDVAVDGGYYIPKEQDGKWVLDDNGLTAVLDLSDVVDDEGYRLKIDTFSGYDRYVYSVTGDDSIFYRGISAVDIIDDPMDGVEDYAVLEVVVEWKEGQKIRSFTRDFILYNYNQ